MQLTLENWLDIIGSIVGLIYIWQEYKASVYLWITGIIMPVIYIFVYLNAGLYADFAMQVYYALAAVYGLLVWRFGLFGKRHQADRQVEICHVPKRLLPVSLLFFVVSWAVLYVLLSKFTNSTVPVLDSFGNALSFVGLWWLSRKFVEQWLLWIVVDAELSALYVYKHIPFTAALYAVYVVLAIAGYFNWKKSIKTHDDTTTDTH